MYLKYDKSSFFSRHRLNMKKEASNVLKSASALKICTYLQSFTCDISPEFAQTSSLCLFFEDLGDNWGLQIRENGDHLTGFFFSVEDILEARKALTRSSASLIRFLKAQSYQTEVVEQKTLTYHNESFFNDYQKAMLFFELLDELYKVEEWASTHPKSPLNSYPRLEHSLALLALWTKFLTKEWIKETGKPISADDLVELVIRLLILLPREKLTKIFSVVEKISDCDLELTGKTSYALVTFNLALSAITNNLYLVNTENETLEKISNNLSILYFNCFILNLCLQYREFILESVNNFLFQGQLKTRRYLFNGYLYLEDETHFFNQLLALLPNMQRPWSYNDHIAIMTAFNRLQEINSISSEFTSIHSQQIELSILLWEKLKIFTETLLAYQQDEQWDLFKQSEKEYLNKFEQIMDMGEEVIRRLNQDSNKQICSLDFRQPCVTNDSTIS